MHDSNTSSTGRRSIPSRSRPEEDAEESSLVPPRRTPERQPSSGDCGVGSFHWEEANAKDEKLSSNLIAENGVAKGKPRVDYCHGGSNSADNDYDSDTTEKKENGKKGVVAGQNGEQLVPGAVRVGGGGGEEEHCSVDSFDTRSPVYEDDLERNQPAPLESGAIEPGIVSAYAVDESSVVHEAKIVNQKRQRLQRVLLVAIVLVIVVVGVVVAVVLTTRRQDGNDDTSSNGEIVFETIVEGLCSPRHLTVHNDKLFVAEAGVGPNEIAGDRETATLCSPSTLAAIPGGICFGNSGLISTFGLDGSVAGEPPLTGLFSARPTEGGFTNQVYGPHSVEFDENGDMFTLLGLGYVNASMVAAEDSELVFASILRNDQPVASPWVPLYENNYAGVPIPESNPFHMCMHDGITYVVDAGADILYTYRNVESAGTAEPDSVIVLPKVDNVPAVEPNPRGGPCNDVTPPRGPPFCGQYQDEAGNWFYSAMPVPTAVRVNPKQPNRLYIAYLGGAIWNEPVSGIFYMDLVDGIPQNDTVQVIRGDFWAISDFDFYQDDIFVLETNPGGFVPFEGRLSRVTITPDGSVASMKVITEELLEPVGLAVHGDILYLSNHTFSMGIDSCNGKIARAELK